MHELSVMTYLVESVDGHAREIGAKRVLAINLVVGERTSFVDDSLLFYFDMLTPGTLAEGSQLNVRRTFMRFHCGQCARDYRPTGANFRCPTCDTVGQVTDDGSELLIESLEIET